MDPMGVYTLRKSSWKLKMTSFERIQKKSSWTTSLFFHGDSNRCPPFWALWSLLCCSLALSPLLGVSQLVQLALGESPYSCPSYHPVIFDISKLHPSPCAFLFMKAWLLHGPFFPYLQSLPAMALAATSNPEPYQALPHVFLTAPQKNKPFAFHVSFSFAPKILKVVDLKVVLNWRPRGMLPRWQNTEND